MGDGQADPLLPAAPRTTSRSCGTSARPRATTSSTTRGSARSARAPASRRCAARSRGGRSRSRRRSGSSSSCAGCSDEPVGVDVVELPVLFALQQAGRPGRRRPGADAGRPQDQDARTRSRCSTPPARWSTPPTTSSTGRMRPGFRENDCVALVNKVLFELGSEHVEGVNAISGERCSPHPHVFTDRMLRPGDPAYFDILHAYNGYRTCYYRTFAVGSASRALVDAYKRCRDYPRPGDRDRSGRASRPPRSSSCSRRRRSSASRTRRRRSRSSTATASGSRSGRSRSSAGSSRSTIRRRSRRGWSSRSRRSGPSTDGWSAARIEEQLVVTATGARGDHALPGRGAARHRRRPVHGRRPAAGRARGDLQSQQPAASPTQWSTRRASRERMPAEVIMPALGMAQETGKVLRWLKADGDDVAKGEPLLEVETDKVTVEIESPADGTLAAVSAAEGAEVPVGTVIALVLAARRGARGRARFSLGDRRAGGRSRTGRPAGGSGCPARAAGAAQARLAEGAAARAGDRHRPRRDRRQRSRRGRRRGRRGGGARACPPAPPRSEPVWQRMAERMARAWQEVPQFVLTRDVDATRAPVAGRARGRHRHGPAREALCRGARQAPASDGVVARRRARARARRQRRHRRRDRRRRSSSRSSTAPTG